MKLRRKSILGFFDKYRFLSNFYPSEVEFEGIAYYSVEAAYQAAKTLDEEIRKSFIELSPGEAKRKGIGIQLREDWEKIKLGIMEELVRKKFENNNALRNKLLATDSAYLEETNHWKDKFWGIYDGDGENHLGKILMKIRAELASNS